MQNQFTTRRWTGSLTPFVALVLVVCIGFSQVVIEGSRVYLAQARANRVFLSGVDSVLGEFDKSVLEQYHIFLIDEERLLEGSLSATMKTYVEQNLNDSKEAMFSSFYQYKEMDITVPQKIYVTKENSRYIQNQIREYMKYRLPAEVLQKNKNQVQELENDQNDVVFARDRLGAAAENARNHNKEEKQQMEDTTEVEISAKSEDEDPRDVLKSVLSGDMVALLTGKDVSKDKIIEQQEEKEEKEFLDAFETDGKVFDDSDKVTAVIDEHASGGLIDSWDTKGLNLLYFTNCLSNLAEQQKDHRLEYETEYLIAGKDNEHDNLKQVLNQITACRFALNYAYVITNPTFCEEAAAVATGIAGATANPVAIELVKYLLLAAQAYGESLYDVRVLCHGGKVPLKKNGATFKISLHNFSAITQAMNGEENQEGQSYIDYLRILLLMKMDEEETYGRFFREVELTKKKKTPNFKISTTVVGFCAQGQVTRVTGFSSLLGIKELDIDILKGEDKFLRYAGY